MKIRRKFITDVIERYIEMYPDEFAQFLRQVEYKRAMANDKKFGKVSGDSELRVGLTIPESIMRSIQYVLKGEEKQFGEEKGEMKWFAKKFPQFVVPNEY